MAEHNELGKLGEKLSVDYLKNKGYQILETNWIFQKAEIDIIAQKENVLAIVEVKTRSSTDFGLPQDFVKPKKIQLLVKAVNEYVISKDLEVEVRFDIIAINSKVKSTISPNINDSLFEINHLKDAFHFF
ncbi:MAG TPA: YraN family protein [Flavobacterium sp.]|jgi:putative endonuclease|nr:YraN family protein [Flavobacterium sp.]